MILRKFTKPLIGKVGLWTSILFFIFFNMFQFFIIRVYFLFMIRKKWLNKSYIYLQGCVKAYQTIKYWCHPSIVELLYSTITLLLNFSFVHAYFPPRFPLRPHPPASPTVLAPCPYRRSQSTRCGGQMYTPWCW